MTTKKKNPEDIVLYASLETEDGVEVELAVSAPTRASARHTIGEITRALTGEDAEKMKGSRIVFTEGMELPKRLAPNPEE